MGMPGEHAKTHTGGFKVSSQAASCNLLVHENSSLDGVSREGLPHAHKSRNKTKKVLSCNPHFSLKLLLDFDNQIPRNSEQENH